MRKDLAAIALGVVLGAAAFVTGDERDAELLRGLERLKSAISRLQREQIAATGDVAQAGGSLSMDFLPVHDLVAPRECFLPPRGPLPGADGFGGPDGGAVLPVGTIEELIERMRTGAAPEAWERGGNLGFQSGKLVVIAEKDEIAECARFLEAVRAREHRSVAVEAQAVDLPHALAARLLAAGGSLGAEEEKLLAAAVDSGAARRLFWGRVAGFPGQRVLLRCGREAAFLADEGRGVALAGGTISVRPTLADDAITLELDVRFDDLEGIDRTGGVETPRVVSATAVATVVLGDRKWGVVGGGTRVGERSRMLLVRPSFLPRKGGA